MGRLLPEPEFEQANFPYKVLTTRPRFSVVTAEMIKSSQAEYRLSCTAFTTATVDSGILPTVESYKQFCCSQGNLSVLNPFAAVLAAPSLEKRPIEVPNLK